MDKKDDIKNNLKDRLSTNITKEDEERVLVKKVHIDQVTEILKKQKVTIENQNAQLIDVYEKQNSLLSKLKSLEQVTKTKILDDNKFDLDIAIEKEELKKNKKSKLDKLWQTLNTPISDLFDKIVSFTDDAPNWKLDAVVSTIKSLSVYAAKGIGFLLDNTLGRLFKFFGDNGNILSNFISKAVLGVWDVVQWVYDFAKKTIQFIWDKFVMLAKVGWKILSTVWEFVSTPLNFIYDIFKEVFISIITTPLGFLLMTIGFAFLIKYAIIPLWPKIKDFIIDIGIGVWNWLEQGIADLVFSGDKSEMRTYFSNSITTIKNWLFGVGVAIIDFYDKYIGSYIGLDSVTIMNFFTGNGGMFTKIFEGVKWVIDSLYKSEIFDQILLAWNFLKDLYLGFLYYFAGGKDPILVKRQKYLNEENETKLNVAYGEAINQYAKSVLEKNLLQEYLKNTNLNKSDLERLLRKKGNSIIDNIKNSTLVSQSISGSEKTQKYLQLLNENILSDIIANVVNFKIEDAPKKLASLEAENNLVTQKLSELSFISKQKGDDLATYLEQYFAKTSKDYVYNMKDVIDSTVIKVNDLSVQFKNSSGEVISDTVRTIRKTDAEGTLNFVSSDIVAIEKYSKEMETKNKLEIERLVNTFSWVAEKEMLKQAHPNLPDGAINAKVFEKFSKSLNEIITKKLAEGGVAKSPSKVIIGEGNYPEIVVPINEKGIEFIKKSTEDVIDYGEVYSEKDSINIKEKNMLKTLKKSMPRKDVKLYDIKNLSHSVVVIG